LDKNLIQTYKQNDDYKKRSGFEKKITFRLI
jgi:hypothetical protein